MKRLKKILLPIIVIAFFLLMGWFIYTNNVTIDKLRSEGKPFVTGVTTINGVNGDKGATGDTGRSPTPEEIAQAVANYCATTGACLGQIPTEAVVFAAVSQFCANNACQGTAGLNATPADVQLAVNSYCSNGSCIGAQGIAGINGTNGESPQLQCVIRLVTDVSTNFIAWKLPSEPNTSYRDLYKLPTWASCISPVDLTVTITP
jgi:hypothetical protein